MTLQNSIIFALLSILSSSIIALSKKYLDLVMEALARVSVGFIILEIPIILLYLIYLPALSWNNLLYFPLVSLWPLIIGGLAGLFYGNAGPEDENWMLSKPLVALYRLSRWITGKQGSDVTILGLGKKDNSEK